MPRKLSVVPPDAVKAPPTGVRDAADHSERAFLVALRTKIASDIDKGVPPHALAGLVRQAKELDREIRALDLKAQQEADEDVDVPDAQFDASAI